MTRILIVEDDPQMRALIARGLAREPYEVIAVSNGMEALVAANGGAVDAAVVDVMLPGIDGFEVCRHLRRYGEDVPVILLTARDAIEDRVRGLDSGADDYLTKPFAIAELAARLRALLRRPSVGANVVAAGDLRLDPRWLQATVAERQVAFSAKEFALLHLLASRAGQDVSRDDILREVWGEPHLFDTNVVDQYVSYVRKKLAASGSVATITTVRGVGYRLDAEH